MTLWKIIEHVVNYSTVAITLLNFFLKIDRFQDLVQKTVFESFLNFKYRNYFVIAILIFFFALHIISYLTNKNKLHDLNVKKHEVFHKLRDGTFSAKIFRRDHENYKRYIKGISETLCQSISEYLFLKYNKHFNICIKMIDITSSRKSTSIDEMKVETLCRGGKDALKRTQQQQKRFVKVKEDTSYLHILSNDEKKGRNSDFVCPNLLFYCVTQKALNKPYLPPIRTFYKKYLSTVVVPIRIDSRELPHIDRDYSTNETGYQVFGFLCLDYKLPIFRKTAKCICEDLKAFADGLYIMFDEALNMDVRYAKRKNEEETPIEAMAVQR